MTYSVEGQWIELTSGHISSTSISGERFTVGDRVWRAQWWVKPRPGDPHVIATAYGASPYQLRKILVAGGWSADLIIAAFHDIESAPSTSAEFGAAGLKGNG